MGDDAAVGLGPNVNTHCRVLSELGSDVNTHLVAGLIVFFSETHSITKTT